MSAATLPSFCLIVCLSMICSSGAQTNITAELGQDVILPCKVPNKNNINDIAVQWIRPDQDPEYVLFYRDGHIDPDNQHPSYQNRVDLQDRKMKDGNFSLILKNVTKNDTGRYECRVFQNGSNRNKRSNLNKELISNITLEVHLSGDKDGGEKFEGNKTGIIVGSVLGMIFVAAAFVGFLIYRRLMKKNQHHQVPPDEPTVIEMLPVPK